MKKNRIDIMQETYSPIYEEAGLHFLPLQKDICCVYCDPSHPLSSLNAISLEDLKGLTVYTEDAIFYEKVVIEKYLHRAGIPTISIKYDAMDLFNVCANGGIFLLESAMRESFRQLTCIPLTPEQPVIHGIIYAPDVSPAAAVFLDYIKERIGSGQIRYLEKLCEESKEQGSLTPSV